MSSYLHQYPELPMYPNTDYFEDHEERRKDELYESNIGMIYNVRKNILFKIEYHYLENNSKDKSTHLSIEDNEYIVNRYNVSLAISF